MRCIESKGTEAAYQWSAKDSNRRGRLQKSFGCLNKFEKIPAHIPGERAGFSLSNEEIITTLRVGALNALASLNRLRESRKGFSQNSFKTVAQPFEESLLLNCERA